MIAAKESAPMTKDNIIYFSKEQPKIDKIDASAVEVLQAGIWMTLSSWGLTRRLVPSR